MPNFNFAELNNNNDNNTRNGSSKHINLVLKTILSYTVAGEKITFSY